MTMNEYEGFFDSLRKYIKALDSIYMGKYGEDSDAFLDAMEGTPGEHLRSEDQNYVEATAEFEEMIKELNSASFDEGIVPYSKITKIIYDETQQELLGVLEQYLKDNWTHYTEEKGQEIDGELKRKFLKLKEHVGLSTVQRSHINNRLASQLADIKKDLSEAQKEVKSVQRLFNESEDSLKNVQDEVKSKYDNIITQFIAILGIFAAILMGAFGSIQGFTSIFDNANDLPIGKLLVVSSIGGAAVILILFFLLSGVSHLSGYSLSSCNCNSINSQQEPKKPIRSRIRANEFVGRHKRERKVSCNCSLIERHPSVVVIHYLMYFISSTGFVLIYLDENSRFSSTFHSPLNIWLTVIAFYLLVTVTLILFHILYVTKKKNIKWYKQFKVMVPNFNK
ncbi:hypothetical protein N781_11425 [Pontibacillus halophilus JSM 076056 = DSM 19796]|uniref:Uncharacterized protein n=1 Tax=Pontibacillus halophilus JSM 076056 = DSM 19796 TaxID=1385510 RepID=A0A0A5G8G7_9BACI|nr:hypothetical protein [Pontibacillus halophilus]KGX88354.1 hypothetical protein N781_11425 [Pontibacillus halophilus JSM 076056 = DSM 19796]